MINTEEFRDLIREVVREEIGDKSIYKIGEIASVGEKVTVKFSGEPEPSQKQYTYLKSYSPGLGDRVILMKDKGTYVVLGKIGERGGGITFGEHLAENAQKHITESGENANGRYVKFDDGTQICIGRGTFTIPTMTQFTTGLWRITNAGSFYFPASFTEVYFADLRLLAGEVISCNMRVLSVSYFSTTIIAYADLSSRSVNYLLLGIGRWK